MVGSIQSAGILLYRGEAESLQLLIAHPGGPFWAKRDAGAWTIPKGIIEENETPLEAARREFAEEIGFEPSGTLIALGSVTLRSRKVVHVWAMRGDFVPENLNSNTLEIEYPRGSARKIRFPEIDNVIWAEPRIAREKLNPAQAEFVDRLVAKLTSGS